MATVNIDIAKEQSVQEVKTDTTEIKTATNRIGEAADTGGTATAGTVMAKLNSIILTNNGIIQDANGKFYRAVMGKGINIVETGVESEAQAGSPGGMAAIGRHVYYADSSARKIIKFNASDLTKVAESEVQNGRATALAADISFLYYASYNTKTIIKFNTSDLTKVAESEKQMAGSERLLVLGDYVYYGESGTNKIIKFKASDLTKVAESEALSDRITGRATGLECDTSLSCIYYTGGLTKKITKLNASDLTKAAESTDQEEVITAMVIGHNYNNYLYCGIGGRVVKFDSSNLSRIAESQLITRNSIQTMVICGNYLYVLDNAQRGIIKLSMHDLSVVAESNSIAERSPHLVGEGDFLYCGTSGLFTGAKVIKFDPAALEVKGYREMT